MDSRSYKEILKGHRGAVGSGWDVIIDAVFEIFEEIGKRSRWRPVPSQVKEKFGGLRIYFSMEEIPFEEFSEIHKELSEERIKAKWDGGIYLDEHCYGVVEMAETMSFKICEECGATEKVVTDKLPGGCYWIKTLCPECRKKFGEEMSVKNKVIVKKFGIDFYSDGNALTLTTGEVCDKFPIKDYKEVLERTHDDGWTISGVVHEDYYEWVNDFEAHHPKYGRVWGNFEEEVYADSEEGFKHFYENHEPTAWDYGDI